MNFNLNNIINNQGNNYSNNESVAGQNQVVDVCENTKGDNLQSQGLGQLSKGDVFSGEILDIRNQYITIMLDNNELIYAKMQQALELNIGEKMLFQVKDNNNSQIVIKPFQNNFINDELVNKSLLLAGVTSSDKNIAIVKELINNGEPIDKQSILNTIRLCSQNKNEDIEKLILMNKYGIEINKNNLQQFDNYTSTTYKISDLLDNISENFTELIRDEVNNQIMSSDEFNVKNLLLKLSDIFETNNDEAKNLVNRSIDETYRDENTYVKGNDIENINILGKDSNNISYIDNRQDSGNTNYKILENNTNTEEYSIFKNNEPNIEDKLIENYNLKDNIFENSSNNITENSSNNLIENSSENLKNNIIENSFNNIYTENLASNVVNTEENYQSINNLSREPEYNLQLSIDDTILNSIYNLDKEINPFSKLISALDDILKMDNPQKAKELINSNEFNKVIKKIFSSKLKLNIQEYIENKDFNAKETIKDYYDKLMKAASAFENNISNDKTTSLQNSFSQIKSNLMFMSDLNDQFSYVQLPFKFHNNKGHSELYVYNNKKKLKYEEDEVLSAFLHFNMEYLGATDIDIKMKNHNLKVNFALEDNTSTKVVKENFNQLINRLNKLGYKVDFSVKTQEAVKDSKSENKKFSNPIDTIFKGNSKDKSIKRYTLDIRT